MKIVVLGHYGSFAGRDGACSGYFIQTDKSTILVDCGNGILSRLQRYCRIEELDAIVVSHLHDDHIGDLRILRYAVETKQAFKQFDGPVKVFMPQSPAAIAEEIRQPAVFDTEYIYDGLAVEIKGLSLRFALMEHSIESYAISIEEGSKRTVYTADTVYNEKLVVFSQNADLLISEATFANLSSLAISVPHMDALQAGLIARRAGVKQLLLTHFWYEENIKECVKAAKQNFSNVSAADELKEYIV
jgi:ribonuclease BN (tRNA processing enzyme)